MQRIMCEKIVVKNLYKVFGEAPHEAMQLLDKGLDKDEVFERTAQSIGVNNASITIHEGEIFVIMGLSASALDPLIRTEMQDELLKLQQEHRRTIIFIDGENFQTIIIMKALKQLATTSNRCSMPGTRHCTWL